MGGSTQVWGGGAREENMDRHQEDRRRAAPLRKQTQLRVAEMKSLTEHFWDEGRGTGQRQAMQKLDSQLENLRFEFTLLIMHQ